MSGRYGGNVENLPKWAQRSIGELESEIRGLREKVVELNLTLAGQGGSDFYISRGLHEDDLPLATHDRWLNWKQPDGFEVRLCTQDGDLQVMVTSWHGLVIKPSASNVVTVGRGRTR